jgi:hypothetical protein
MGGFAVIILYSRKNWKTLQGISRGGHDHRLGVTPVRTQREARLV